MQNPGNEIRIMEERTRRLEIWLKVAIAVWLLTIGFIGLSLATSRSHAQQTATEKMKVSELVIIDKNGVERVRIGGDLPDAIIGGKRVPRGQQAAGVLLYDASGTERSGYVTFEPSGNVGLTLDSKTAQVASFVASAEGNASAFSLWHGKEMIEVRSDSEGARLTAVKDGQVAFQEPNISRMSDSMCSAYKDAFSRVSATQVMSDCRRRFLETACRACLDKK